MCGRRVLTKTDVCVINGRGLGDIILLVQEDKRHLEKLEPEPQLIAEAISAFQSKNTRLSRMSLPTLNQMTIPGITTSGTAPTFCKINITTAFVEAVEAGMYSSQATIVHKLVPPAPRLKRLERYGMRPLEHRAVILGCFEAFKQFVLP